MGNRISSPAKRHGNNASNFQKKMAVSYLGKRGFNNDSPFNPLPETPATLWTPSTLPSEASSAGNSSPWTSYTSTSSSSLASTPITQRAPYSHCGYISYGAWFPSITPDNSRTRRHGMEVIEDPVTGELFPQHFPLRERLPAAKFGIQKKAPSAIPARNKVAKKIKSKEVKMKNDKKRKDFISSITSIEDVHTAATGIRFMDTHPISHGFLWIGWTELLQRDLKRIRCIAPWRSAMDIDGQETPLVLETSQAPENPQNPKTPTVSDEQRVAGMVIMEWELEEDDSF